MKPVLTLLACAPLVFLAACHDHPRHTAGGLPVPRPIDEAGLAGAPTRPVTPEVKPVIDKAPVSDEAPLNPPAVIGDPISEPKLLSLADAYFDLDRADLRADARRALVSDSSLLKEILAQNPSIKMVIEGHCDERGSAEYNLALGSKRAEAAQQLLEALGIPAATLRAISYGKERPQCTTASEDCWQKNRRAHVKAQ